jgi:glycosyltransferase involved in cell wall biosynthesis
MDKQTKKIFNSLVRKLKKADKRTLLISHLHLSPGGGAEISLVNLIEEVHDDFDITLLLFHKRKDAVENIRRILPHVRVVYVEDALRRSRKENAVYLEILKGTTKGKIMERKFIRDVALRAKKRLFGEYVFDYGIEYFGVYIINGLLLREACKKAFVFQHTDIYMNLSNHLPDIGKSLPTVASLNRYYNKFDKVVAVGEGIREINARKLEYPESLLRKSAVATNFIDYKKVLKGGNEPLPPDICLGETTNFCYFGRLAQEKNIENLIKGFAIFVNEVNNGDKYRLFLIGRDELNGSLQELARECGMDNSIIFAGNHENPFPIIKKMHLFILPSFFESFSLSLHEARILGVPALMANFEAAESLREPQDIITGHSAEELAQGMRRFVDSGVIEKRTEIDNAWLGVAYNKKAKDEFLKLFDDAGDGHLGSYAFDKSKWGKDKMDELYPVGNIMMPQVSNSVIEQKALDFRLAGGSVLPLDRPDSLYQYDPDTNNASIRLYINSLQFEKGDRRGENE